MADQLIPPLSLPVLNERGLLDTRWAAFVRMLADAVNGTTGVVETRASYPSGLTIAGVASNASITVSAHTRQYASLAKPVQAGTVTGLTYGTTYYVYYDDLQRAGACLLRRHNDAHGRLLLARNPPATTVGRVTITRHRRGIQHPAHAAIRRVCMPRSALRETWSFGRRWPPIRHAPLPLWERYAGSGDNGGACSIVLPLAAEHGGFFFTRLDTLGLVMELYTSYPGGWGRVQLPPGRRHMMFGVGKSGDDDHGSNGHSPGAPSRPVLRVSRRRASFKKRRWRGPRLDVLKRQI